MKAFILSEKEFEDLLAAIDRNPEHGPQGGSSSTFTDVERRAFHDAHRFYNYQVRTWIDRVQK